MSGKMGSGLGHSTSRSGNQRNPRTRPRRPIASAARCIVEAMEQRTLLSAVQLDPTFGTGGQTITNLALPSRDVGTAGISMPNGDLVVAGYSQDETSIACLIAYKPDGSLDSSFANGGVVQFPQYLDPCQAYSLQTVTVGGQVDILVGVVCKPTGTEYDKVGVLRFHSDGTLDPTFGANGLATSALNSAPDSGGGAPSRTALAVQSDGKIIQTGRTHGSSDDMAVVRFDTNGTIDTSFGNGGITSIDFGGKVDYATSVGVDSAGRIAVGGYGYTDPASADFELARLTPNGALDASFGAGGKITTDIVGMGLADRAYALLIGPGDRIILGGFAIVATGFPNEQRQFALAEYNTDGTLDSSFGNGGIVTTDVIGAGPGQSNQAGLSGLAFQGTQIVAAGNAGSRGCLVRYNPDGSLDTTFNGTGRYAIDQPNFNYSIDDRGIAPFVTSDGGIFLIGSDFNSHSVFNSAQIGSWDVIVQKLTVGGTLDGSFGSAGQAITPLTMPSGDGDFGPAISITLPDNKIVMATTAKGWNLNSFLARYNPDGSLDTTFGNGGIVPMMASTAAGEGAVSSVSEALSLQTQAVGGQLKLLVGGRFNIDGFDNVIGIWRYNLDGSIDSTFGANGFASCAGFTVYPNGFPPNAVGLAVQGDGKILETGETNHGTDDMAVARFNADGSLDTSFGSGGLASVDFGGNQDYATCIGIDSSGRIVLGGYSISGVTGADFAVARLTPDGAIDNTFGNNGTNTTDFAGGNDEARAMIIDAAGSIVLGGVAQEVDADFAIAKYTPNGLLDPHFGSGGRVTTNLGITDQLNGLASQGADILAVGIAGGTDGAVVRFNPDGSLDSSFNGNGVFLDGQPNFVPNFSAATVDSENRILLTGSDYSFATDIKSCIVARLVNIPTNHAPVLSGANDFPTITEDNVDLGNVAKQVADLTAGFVSDADQPQITASAIAVVGQNPGNGTWQYQDNISYQWHDIGNVSDTSALLLPADRYVRFVPDGKNGTTASLTFRAWDMSNAISLGNNQWDLQYTYVDTSANGGSSPYSANTATTHITVTDVNDAPVLTGANPFPAITEDDVTNTGQSVAQLLSGHVTDVDNGALPSGIAVLQADNFAGAWQYSLDSGATWISFPAYLSSQSYLGASSALLLGPDALVRDLPNGAYGTGSTAIGVPDDLWFKAWDQSDGRASGSTMTDFQSVVFAVDGSFISTFSNATIQLTLSIADVNDAPLLDGANDFPSISAADRDNSGVSAFSLIAGHTTDVDLDAPYAGNVHNTRSIAITGDSGPGAGVWQYNTGGAWTDIGPVSDTSALLMDPGAAIRFRPDGIHGGDATLSFRAWDGSNDFANTRFTYVDVSLNGGSTPYSAQIATAHLIVIPLVVPTLSLASTAAVYGQATTLTATLFSNASPVSNALITFSRADHSVVGTATTNANGVAVLGNVSIAGLDAGTHTNAFTASFAGDATHAASTAAASLTVIDENIQGMVWVDFNNDGNVDFGEQGIGGVPISLLGSNGNVVAMTTTDSNGLYTFNHMAPDVYSISEGSDGPGFVEGKDSLGTITDLQGNLISAGAGNASVQDLFSNVPVGADQNAINYNFGEQPTAASTVSKGQAATMGFWQNKNGQALISQFASIGNWLADTMPQTFGSLAGATPQQVATLYQQKFVLTDKLDAQVMATALNVYATDASLGGSAAASYGFAVSTYGLGDSTWNIGSDGAAFNVANNSTLTIMQILQDWDQQNNKSNKSIRQLALDVFGGINAKGGI